MIIDGKKLAQERIQRMREFVDSNGVAPSLVALTVAPNAPTKQFLKIKTRVADAVGISMSVVELPETAAQHDVYAALQSALSTSDGIVVQLPFPATFDVDRLLTHIPADLDPDCMGAAAGALLRTNEHIVLPPVVSAIRAIVREHALTLTGKKVAVVGQGRLVGAPSATWFEGEGADVTRLTRSSVNLHEAMAHADIVILGAGSPGLLTRDMVAEGVVIFDAGSSEEGGKLVGDADPRCALKASLITPVPGGIGPLAVAELFGNLLRLRYGFEGNNTAQ